MIEISEIYFAPQGEGPNMGRSSLFVRVRRCVLSCNWCDSRFTWDEEDEGYTNFQTYEPWELVSCMLLSSDSLAYTPHAIVFTGGEPLIYQRELLEVIDLYRRQTPIVVEVETAGTIVPSAEMLRRCHFNVSPKLNSAGNAAVPISTLWRADATRAYFHSSATFKLVVGADDVTSLNLYLGWLRRIGAGEGLSWDKIRHRVYLMPEGTTPEKIAENLRQCIDLATNFGTRVTTRLHIQAYGNERRR